MSALDLSESPRVVIAAHAWVRVGEDGRVRVLSPRAAPQPLMLALSPSRARNRLEVQVLAESDSDFGCEWSAACRRRARGVGESERVCSYSRFVPRRGRGSSQRSRHESRADSSDRWSGARAAMRRKRCASSSRARLVVCVMYALLRLVVVAAWMCYHCRRSARRRTERAARV